MKFRHLFFQATLLLLLPALSLKAQHTFIHPGLTYTQGDLDRMKAMVAARQEPFYTTFLALSKSIVTPGRLLPLTIIKEGQFNNTIGLDGRRAHDNALMWKLTGNNTYAANAVAYLNRYLDLKSASCRGTGPLDNGKVYLLIEAAELMRDYPGWSPRDQHKFGQMLVHPGYSTKAAPLDHFNSDDSINDVTFYWNIYNFDPQRFGNQGLFAARSMMAMGIFLDNDTIYNRSYRYLLDLPHRVDDLPYKTGPAIPGTLIRESPYLNDYHTSWGNTEPDFHTDEPLKYYVYQNGQCQESCRDQAHVFAGIGNYTCLAEMAWNQGDSLYSCLNNRILLGLEWNIRYNLSPLKSFPDQRLPWDISGHSTKESDCTYENGLFYEAWSRSGRWFGKDISPLARSTVFGPSGFREQAVAHYLVRAGVNPESMLWLQRSLDLLISEYGYENWGTPGHHYDWLGWGTLTKRLKPWMAGDPGTFRNGKRQSGIPVAPCMIKAVDYDFYPDNGEGHTYHRSGQKINSPYRNDGSMVIVKDNDDDIVTDLQAGDWMNYGVIFPAPEKNKKAGITCSYNIYATYRSKDDVKLAAAVDDVLAKKTAVMNAASTWTERLLGTFSMPCGADVLRLYVEDAHPGSSLQLKSIRLEAVK